MSFESRCPQCVFVSRQIGQSTPCLLHVAPEVDLAPMLVRGNFIVTDLQFDLSTDDQGLFLAEVDELLAASCSAVRAYAPRGVTQGVGGRA